MKGVSCDHHSIAQPKCRRCFESIRPFASHRRRSFGNTTLAYDLQSKNQDQDVQLGHELGLRKEQRERTSFEEEYDVYKKVEYDFHFAMSLK